MNTLFNLCVAFLYLVSDLTGISYEAINIWLFVIIHPVITLVLFVLYIRIMIKYRKLKHKTKNVNKIQN